MTGAGLSTMTGSIGDPSATIADAVHLANSSVAISFLPGAGGNISAITDLRTGRNWLWQNPHLPIANERRGENYGASLDSGGWDEMLLSVSAAEIEMDNSHPIEIADHGDLIRQSWTAEIQSSASGQNSCRMTAVGSTLNYEFVRTAHLQADLPKITFDYSLTNNETFEWPFYWCPHALVAVQPEMRIELPPDTPFHLDGSGAPTLASWPWLSIPDGSQQDLSTSFAVGGKKFAQKIFARAPSDGSVSVLIPTTKERLTMTFDPDFLPWLGLWINNEGWSGCDCPPYTNLGLEPTTTNYDCVRDALRNDAITLMQPGETKTWSLTVDLN